MGDFFFTLAAAALVAATLVVTWRRVTGKGTRRTETEGE
jgi:hypothetical protein